MKEIKAFIRASKTESVLEKLGMLGIDGITLGEVMGLGALADPRNARYSIAAVKRYSKLTKLEIVCSDQDVHAIVEALRETAYSGAPGDGIIFVSELDMAVKIRTGATGDQDFAIKR